VREEAYETFNEKVKILARKHAITSGKWMLFPRGECGPLTELYSISTHVAQVASQPKV